MGSLPGPSVSMPLEHFWLFQLRYFSPSSSPCRETKFTDVPPKRIHIDKLTKSNSFLCEIQLTSQSPAGSAGRERALQSGGCGFKSYVDCLFSFCLPFRGLFHKGVSYCEKRLTLIGSSFSTMSKNIFLNCEVTHISAEMLYSCRGVLTCQQLLMELPLMKINIFENLLDKKQTNIIYLA